ncbi:hypothetical protein LPUS_08608 [Lasallia pustulata]|uniref:IBR domain-containing protein n=1 Tax=Lasallia pustulata TaxID=136370 RepID=A0A1W5D5S1_9LECA|nr:hypothetical protein LPUS_08608 [Lasallia pustulata]
MSVSVDRSHSDLENIEQAEAGDYEETDTYNMKVLGLESGQTERSLDRSFLRAALKLGIAVPQNTGTTLERVASNISALDLSSAQSEPEIDPETCISPSRFSQSTQPLSCGSSIDQQTATTTSSLTTAPSATPSIASSECNRRSYTRFKQGIRRFSTFRKRKTLNTSVSSISSIYSIPTLASTSSALKHTQEDRFVTANLTSASSIPEPSPPTPSLLLPSPGLGSPPVVALHTDKPLPSHPEPKHDDGETLAARERSMSNEQILNLRAMQLEQQARFLKFGVEQHRLMRTKQAEARQAMLDEYKERERAMQDRHTDTLSTVEHRQLTAEVDLRRNLELERHACNTKLKHMEAYCNNKSIPVDNMPQRVVTDKDLRALGQQYHVRNGMETLHEGRINVLREKQAKQLERILVKQEAEAEALACQLERDIEDLVENQFVREQAELRRQFLERKYRLVGRWMLGEAIERRELEMETGEVFGPLPKIDWPAMARISVVAPVEGST